jgi:hypothetical protein
MNRIHNFESFNETVEIDIKNNNLAKRIYRKIVDTIRSIQLNPTDENDFNLSTKGKKVFLKGIKFNLSIIDKRFDINIYIVEMINNHKNLFYDENNNRLIFCILPKDTNNFEMHAYFAKIRFETWIDENQFVHEFIHYLDKLRYSKTYKFKYSDDLGIYYNSAEEMNAYYHELLNAILKQKNKLKKYNVNDFIKYVWKNLAHQEWKNYLTDKNSYKVNTRLYKLYNKLFINNI